MRKIVYLFSIIVCIVSTFIQDVAAQGLEHKLGEFIVVIKEGYTIEDLSYSLQLTHQRAPILHAEQLIPNKNIYLLVFDPYRSNELKLMDTLFDLEATQYVQFNHLVSERAIPNDPLLSQQWQYVNPGLAGAVANADIDAQLAWDISTGGVTMNGDTIVVAVIDGGIDIQHEDLLDNRWYNFAETPNNGIDDDDNGYVDDFAGYNSDDDDDNIAGGNHGTGVNGIIGAKGNNNLGVSGVCWDVKIMNIKYRAEGRDEARILKAYGYPLVQRTIYNETNGEEGAFIVAINASWGIDFAQPSEFQLWCDIYDDLGALGILSCASTANLEVDVDLEGDMPTACDSDYLISVTNMNDKGEKRTSAGFGQTSIDLGAYGELVYTTTNGSNYGFFNGTSAATPHVSGAIALLYSAPCQAIADLALSDPGAAARQMKEYILEGTKPNESIENITVTGGVLNLFNSQVLLRADCNQQGDANALRLFPNPIGDQFLIEGFDVQSSSATVRIFDSKGALLRQAESLAIIGGTLKVDGVTGLAAGIYFASVVVEGKENRVVRFFVY